MLQRLRPRLSYANVMATAAFLMAAGGGAYAATSLVGSSGTIRGCVNKTSGVLRVVHPGAKCQKHREQAITWNQHGPRGLRGLQGKQGKPGMIFGDALQTDGSDPNPSPDESGTFVPTQRRFSFTLPAGGRVYIRWNTRFLNVPCNPAESSFAGLYVDGNALPGTSQQIPDGGGPLELITVTTLAPGPHTVLVRTDCPGTNVPSTFQGGLGSNFTVLLIG